MLVGPTISPRWIVRASWICSSSPDPLMRTAIFQMTSGIDPERNAQAMVQAIHTAKARGADMLFTPEMAGQLDRDRPRAATALAPERSEEHTSELQSLMRISYAVFCLKKNKNNTISNIP